MYKSCLRNLKTRDHLSDQGRDGKMILKLILEKKCVQMRTGLQWLRVWSSGMFCEQ
jgi:hypothetical protein